MTSTHQQPSVGFVWKVLSFPVVLGIDGTFQMRHFLLGGKNETS